MVAVDDVKTSQQHYFPKYGLQKYMFTKEKLFYALLSLLP